MATFPRDQFDDHPEDLERVGAHRGPKVRGRGWIGFGWAVLATAILVVGGLYILSLLNDSIKFPTIGSAAATTSTPQPSVSTAPQIQPVTDPTKIKSRHITITILNGTAIVGLEEQAYTKLKLKHWSIGSKALASVNTVKQTVVYYSSPANKDVAEGLQLALGTGTIQLSDAFKGAPITIVLGKDFAG
jgi:hypothetical protein